MALTLKITPKSYTYRKYSATMRKLGMVPPPLTKTEQMKSWNQELYIAEKERCFNRLQLKINTPEDYMEHFHHILENEWYEAAQGISEVLADSGFNTLKK